jgi:glutathionylspermidine synthase
MAVSAPWLAPARIAPDAFADYRLRVIFEACKWDPQVGDQGTIGACALRLRPEAWIEVATLAEALDRELRTAEAALWQHPQQFRELGMPRALAAALRRRQRHETWPDGLYLRRYDFHFTDAGWRISEVNADVPGGFAEASILPRLAGAAGIAGEPAGDILGALRASLGARCIDPAAGVLALVHATAYADDRQVMAAIATALAADGREALPAAPDHLQWSARAPHRATLRGRPVTAIFRFFPVEWLPELGRSAPWQHFLGGAAVAPLLCNPGVAALAQSKRAPLLWRRLGLELPTWRRLLPETTEADTSAEHADGAAAWLHKPAYGRVGGGIVSAGWTAPAVLRRWRRAVRWDRRGWVRQRRFATLPVACADRLLYPCLGVFVLDGRCCGVYGRASFHPLIDQHALDLPVLIGAPARAQANTHA